MTESTTPSRRFSKGDRVTFTDPNSGVRKTGTLIEAGSSASLDLQPSTGAYGIYTLQLHDGTLFRSEGVLSDPECTCGANYHRGCFCNLTVPEFMRSKYAKGL